MNWITIVSSFISGLLCSMGFGGGSVFIIFLTSYLNTPQKEAQGMNLFFFIPCALYSVYRYNKDGLIIKNVARNYIIWGIAGVVIGYIILSLTPPDYLRKAFGALLILMGIKDLLSKKGN